MSVLLKKKKKYFIFIQGKQGIESGLDVDNKSSASLVGQSILPTVLVGGGAQFEIYPLEGNALSIETESSSRSLRRGQREGQN